MTERGTYSVLEGSDYTGKTTQMQLIKQFAYEHGIETMYMREPGGTPYGARIRELILHTDEDIDSMTEFLLFTADRNHSWNSAIEPALSAGINVVSDRSWISTVIYQGYGGGKIAPERLARISRDILPEHYIRPDHLAVLSLSRAKWLERKFGRLESEAADTIERRDDPYFERVHEGYSRVKEIAPYAKIIDADAEPEVVFDHLRPIFFPQYHKH